MAEALMNLHSQGRVKALSAGTKAALGSAVNQESATSVAELGADMSLGTPKFASPEDFVASDRIVILGSAARLDTDDESILAKMERWETIEPSHHGIEGSERMNLIRDDINSRILALLADLENEPEN